MYFCAHCENVRILRVDCFLFIWHEMYFFNRNLVSHPQHRTQVCSNNVDGNEDAQTKNEMLKQNLFHFVWSRKVVEMNCNLTERNGMEQNGMIWNGMEYSQSKSQYITKKELDRINEKLCVGHFGVRVFCMNHISYLRMLV